MSLEGMARRYVGRCFSFQQDGATWFIRNEEEILLQNVPGHLISPRVDIP